jgi:hypothetical protein
MSTAIRATLHQSTIGAGYCAKRVRTLASIGKFRSHDALIALAFQSIDFQNENLSELVTQGQGNDGREMAGCYGDWMFETPLTKTIRGIFNYVSKPVN